MPPRATGKRAARHHTWKSQWFTAAGGGSGQLLLAVELLERLELLDERLVLVLQHGHATLQTLDVLLLLPPALARRLPVRRMASCYHRTVAGHVHIKRPHQTPGSRPYAYPNI